MKKRTNIQQIITKHDTIKNSDNEQNKKKYAKL